VEAERNDSDPVADLLRTVEQARLPPTEQRSAIRTAAGVTLREMAAALQVSHTTAHAWEQGRSSPRLAHAIAYRKLLEALLEASDGAS